MVFSSATFLFFFLPAVLGCLLLLPRKFHNLLLLLFSLFFYAWGELYFVLLLLISIAANYLFGYLIGGLAAKTTSARIALILGIIFNLGLLGYFKYASFLIENWNSVALSLGWQPYNINQVHLPLGVSFFTFQALSYLIDVYRGDARHSRNPVHVAVYIALFPQLIAGPIIRYKDIQAQILERQPGFALAYSGMCRFIFGLAKKLLIANPLGYVADQIFALQGDDLTTPLAWLGIICYTLQIYFDFSGYSDMAIGLGRMFGFKFLENFNYPYAATSLRDFWRRWHISLSNWFRDYLYIPLGGNRRHKSRTHLNLLIVFLLCGLWHGASWNFVIWGLIHGAFLVLERTSFGVLLTRTPALVQHGYTLLVVMLAWVFFRAETLPEAVNYLTTLFSVQAHGPHDLAQFLRPHIIVLIISGALLSLPVWRRFEERYLTAVTPKGEFIRGSIAILLAGLSVVILAASTYNPFIYFRF